MGTLEPAALQTKRLELESSGRVEEVEELEGGSLAVRPLSPGLHRAASCLLGSVTP